MTARPRPKPCDSCPFRRDVPSGVWAAKEYDKLIPYDGETWQQPIGVFMCHQADGCVCSGWAAVCGDENNLALRIAGRMDPEVDVQACLDYTSPVPLFASATEAAEHGMADIDWPSEEAIEKVARLETVRKRKE